jgi:hypothetical protein
MDLRFESRQPVMDAAGSPESWIQRAPGLAVDDERSLAGPGRRPYSYWAECECPGDCPRDHENE